MARSSGRRLLLPSYPRIYGCAPLADDEALSSWIMLIAATRRCPVKELFQLWNYQVSNAYAADISGHIPPLSAMSSMTFESGRRLAGAHWAGATILADDRFSCLSAYHDGVPVHLYCPSCLAQDSIPYLRKHWRLAYQFVCESHHRLLRDSCSHCCRRIDYTRFHRHKPKTGISSFFRDCPHCGFDLVRAPSVSAESAVLSRLQKAQRQFHRLVISPSFKHPTAGTVSSTKILQSLLIPQNRLLPAGSSQAQYSQINFGRLFLNHCDEVVSILQQGRRGLFASHAA